MQQNWDWFVEIHTCEDKISNTKRKKLIQMSCSERSVNMVNPNIFFFFSKFYKLKDSTETLLIKKHNSSHCRGETFSHSQNKCKIVLGKLLLGLTLSWMNRPYTNFMEKRLVD